MTLPSTQRLDTSRRSLLRQLRRLLLQQPRRLLLLQPRRHKVQIRFNGRSLRLWIQIPSIPALHGLKRESKFENYGKDRIEPKCNRMGQELRVGLFLKGLT